MEGSSKRAAPRRGAMVGWYDPRQLFATGLQTVLSSVFGRRADFRMLEALYGKELGVHDYSAEDTVWIDYIADLGDGFNSTYGMARLLAREAVSVREGGREVALPRGRILVMGGDEVYPTPSPAGYEERLVMPYSCALPEGSTKEPVDLFAIPGNHDWYDGLGSFVNLFCHGRSIGAYRTPQSRSYFALRFARGWWLLGVDVQLDSDIDTPQLDAFLNLPIAPGDRVILCNPEPEWVYEAVRARAGEPRPLWKRQIERLEARIAERGATIVLKVAGDLHHYRRHRPSKGGPELVTAGGGGAFLHPTHTNRVPEIPIGAPPGERTHELVAEYPSASTSRWLSLWNLAFPFFNPLFGLATGLAYMILSWVMPPPALPADRFGAPGARELLMNGLTQLATSTPSLVWTLVILLAFVAFTDTSRRLYKWIGGLIHGTAHLGAALLVAASVHYAFNDLTVQDPVRERLALSLGSFAGGYLVGGLLMGIYLVISVLVFRRHGNEAFSALKIEGYKNFLRMRLDAEGLTVWALGVERVPSARQWEWACEGDGPGCFELKPNAPALVPEVIDRFTIPSEEG